MTTVVTIISHTPIWVFPLIVAVILIGSRSLRARRVSLRRLVLLPAILLAISIANSLSAAAPAAQALAAWGIALGFGGVAGWLGAARARDIDVASGRLTLPGSAAPLVLCIAIVGWRYLFGYLYGRYPELRADAHYALAFIAGNALLAGIMLGRATACVADYWRAASVARQTAARA